MKTIDDIKGEIDAKINNAPLNCVGGGDYKVCRPVFENVQELRDSILSIPIQKGGVCQKCKGNGEYFVSAADGCGTPHIEQCPKCKGTGSLPDITVKDAIEEKLK